MRNVYHFVYRLSACLEKHGQFHKLGNIYNKEMVPERMFTAVIGNIQKL
jgi:hypothetical protein